MATDNVIRTGIDWLRYSLLFEGILALLFTATMLRLFHAGVRPDISGRTTMR
jgi:hypothetical protein